MWRLVVEDNFSAAHKIPGHAGKCANLHGHNYAIRVAVATTKLNELGFVVDIALIRTLLAQCITDKFDHQYLNNLPAFTTTIPSLENLAAYIYKELCGELTQLDKGLELLWVEVAESATAVVRYQPNASP